MIEPPSVVIRVPRPAAEPPREGFPWVPALVPLAVAGVLVAVTGSPTMLVVGLAGPALAVGGTLAARRARQRARRRDADRCARETQRAAAHAAEVARRERERLDALAGLAPRWTGAPSAVIAVARGRVASGVALEGGEPGEAGSGDAAGVGVADLPRRLRAATLLEDAPVLADCGDGIAVDGAPVLAAAVARVLLLRIAAVASPVDALVTAPSGETWVRELPHVTRSGSPGEYRVEVAGRSITVSWGRVSPPGARCVDARGADAATRAEAAAAARGLAVAARALTTAGAAVIPSEVAFLRPAETPRPNGLGATLGRDAAGEVTVDLASDGPHAVVGGTTGSGKSEALVTWVAAMARDRSPREVSFVLLDFKGGAAFDRLRALPHVAGVLTDLDPAATTRALDALGGEVERRERLLAAARVATLEALPAGELARLVLVVDEYAALVARHPEAATVLADLAARGRSLGIHLVLGTQRPSASIGDAILANVGVRLVLRVAETRDSVALLGVDSAARIPATARGRAVLAGAGDAPREFQVARCTDEDLAALATPGAVRATAPWSPPLPDVVRLSDLSPGPGAATAGASLPVLSGASSLALAFGLRDEPRAPAPQVVTWEPRHGHLLVVAGPGSGASTALATLAAASEATGRAARWLPSDPADLWGVLADGSALAEPGLVLADDLDATLAAADAEHAIEIADLVARLLRGSPRRGVRVAASSRGLGGPMRSLTGLFGTRLLLRLPTREEHVLAGGDGANFDARARPGAGEWESRRVQVAIPADAARVVLAGPAPERIGSPEREVAVVSTRPHRIAELWGADRCRTVAEGAADAGPGSGVTLADGAVAGDATSDRRPVAPPRPVILGDPDAWQAEWAVLSRARRELRIILHECSVADVRALTRSRVVPPLLAPGESWLVDGGEVRRVVLVARDTPRRNDGNRTSTAG